jgi:hypothetical protein
VKRAFYSILFLSSFILVTVRAVQADELDSEQQNVVLGGYCIHVTPGQDDTLSSELNGKLKQAGLGYLRSPNAVNEISNYQIMREAITTPDVDIRWTSGGENEPLPAWQVETSLTNPLHEYRTTEDGPLFQPFMYRIGGAAFDLENKPYMVRESGDHGCFFEKTNLPIKIAGATETASEQSSLYARFLRVVSSLVTLLVGI